MSGEVADWWEGDAAAAAAAVVVAAASGGPSLGDVVAAIVFLAWLLSEVLFYIWYRIQLRCAQAKTTPPQVSFEDRQFVLSKMLLHAEDYGMWRQVQGWFLTEDRNAMHSPHEVGRDDLTDLIAWAFFYKKAEDLDEEEASWVEIVSGKIADDYHLDQSLRPGRTGVVSVRHTLDQIRAIHRPLLFYGAIRTLDALHGCLLLARGFRRGRHEGLRYWYRLPSSGRSGPPLKGVTEESQPLVFFHGIGLGLALYLPLLVRLRTRNQILFEMPWIAMNPFAEIPSSTDYARWVVEALRSHGVHQCVALGHSFGSLPIAWLVRQHPGQISRCVLVDPVAIFLNLPDVCVNFLYKQPRSVAGKLIRLFGAREFGIAKTMMRHFFWTDNVLFPEMLPDGSSVILMGSDRLLPVKDIYTSAARLPNVRTTVIEGLDHGHFLVWPSAATTILSHVGGEELSPKGEAQS